MRISDHVMPPARTRLSASCAAVARSPSKADPNIPQSCTRRLSFGGGKAAMFVIRSAGEASRLALRDPEDGDQLRVAGVFPDQGFGAFQAAAAWVWRSSACKRYQCIRCHVCEQDQRHRSRSLDGLSQTIAQLGLRVIGQNRLNRPDDGPLLPGGLGNSAASAVPRMVGSIGPSAPSTMRCHPCLTSSSMRR